ncbi:hypothetical protein PO878_02080 [Iamia majanohamensis]|uniref:Amidohydrolase n=1 Tax=Iamia majanohamensis TaxID=467976 RepID=A0AAF0BU60_9ACTN|nr:hypothetical protein [Iamia majanohamensis]WCO67507.1 hypothetical protein PO878_02080 [Iamia majanohamensis]
MPVAIDTEALRRGVDELRPELGERGAALRARDDVPSHHSPHFAPVQDPTLAAGVEAMYLAARQWLTPR